MNQYEDKELVALYQQGNEEAFRILLLRHKDKIFKTIFLKVKDRELADDLFQEVFIKIIRTLRLGNYNEEGKFLPWAMRIAHNIVIDYFRKEKRYTILSESSSKNEDFNIFSLLYDESPNVQQQICKEELIDQVLTIVEMLPESQKKIVNMRIYEDLSFKEIAEKESISINTALGRMRYAILNMKKIIQKHQLVVDIA